MPLYKSRSVANLTDVAWLVWSPTFTMSTVGGTPITAAVSGGGARYKQIGNTVFFEMDATISNVGVGNSGLFIFTIPVTTSATAIPACVGKEVIMTAKMVVGANWSTTQISIGFADGVTAVLSGGNGTRFNVAGFYRVL